jgi:Schlafen, AlbA_2
MMMAQLTSKELLNDLLEDKRLTPDQLDKFMQDNPDEDQYFDYKDGLITTPQKRKEGRQTIREYVSGFANSDGGVLIIGVGNINPDRLPRAVSPEDSH